MAGIAFNLILIRVAQNRGDMDDRNHLDTQWVKKELSALQVSVPSTTLQDRRVCYQQDELLHKSLVRVEEGV